VLRFFAFRERYKTFQHSVKEFLNDFMASAAKSFDFSEGERVFNQTFSELARVFPRGIRRPGKRRGGTTSLILFEGIAVGASLALNKTKKLSTRHLDKWLQSDELRRYTTGATNDRSAVKGRIEFCRDRFLDKPHVPSTSA
jgi:hypothetical protein